MGKVIDTYKQIQSFLGIRPNVADADYEDINEEGNVQD